MLALNMRRITSKIVLSSFSTSTKIKCKAADPIQVALLEEKCYLVDETDRVIGQASKRACHLVQENGHLPLHRAFSVLLFNEKGDLLMQKRSSQKITYPGMYGNTCCSHPVADFPGEDEEKNALGVKRAVRRRLNYELGIPLEQISLENLKYITRFHYKDTDNGKWGEHEIDYVIFFQGDVKVKLNPNEISEITFVPRKKLDDFISTLKMPMTTCFQLILKHRLKFWWDHLDNLEEIKDHKNISKLS